MGNTDTAGLRVRNVGDAQIRLRLVRHALRERGIQVQQSELAELAIADLRVDRAVQLVNERRAPKAAS